MFLCRTIALAVLAVAPIFFPSSAHAQPATPFDHFSTGFPLTGAHVVLSCDSCHRTSNFSDAPRFCAGCHNNVIAGGKSAAHIPTAEACDTCHHPNSSAWHITSGFSHIGVTQPCADCHNGLTVAGKLTDHINTSEKCESCHASTQVWAAIALVDHGEVLGTCKTCHNGALAKGKPANHILTSRECDTCHRSTTVWTAAVFDHSTITTTCASCHNNVNAIGPSRAHVPVPAALDCAACHRIPPDPMVLAALFDHSQVNAERCDSCHNGQFSAGGAVGKSPNHVPTQTGQDCNLCHRGTTSWTGARFDHAGITGNCASCHNNVIAIGRSAAHVPTPGGTDCGACHRLPPDPITRAVLFDHSQVAAERCETCHNGQYTGGGAGGKSPDHVRTQPSQDCSACHRSTTVWTNVVFDHTGILSDCASCHNGVIAAGRTGIHVPTPAGADCAACHRLPPDPLTSASLFDHSQVATQRCDACHNGRFAGSGALGKTADHVRTPADQDCSLCHRGTTAFADAVFDHIGIVSDCGSCHNNLIAIGRSAVHVPTPAALDCSACHRVPPDPLTNATLFDHSQVASAACDSCHNGQFVGGGAVGKHAAHLPTQPGQDCHACHFSTTTWTGAVFDHTGITSNCASCHNNVIAIGRAPAHVPTPAALDCGGCHRLPPDPLTLAALFDHSQVASEACDSCHNGRYVGGGAIGKSANHVPTQPGQDCHACHLSTVTWAGAVFDHTGITANCVTCHNNAIAIGRAPVHVPTPGALDCGACHRVPPDPFNIANLFDHSQVTAERCESCHNGQFVGGGAVGKSANHVPTQPGQDCSVCHRSTTSWLGAQFDHTGITGNCVSCHNNVIAIGRSGVHVPTPAALDCNACHRVPPPDPFTVAGLFNHTQVAAERCDSCHNGQFTGGGAVGKSPNHVPTQPGQDCTVCHRGTVTWAGATFDHTGILGNCASCHNNVIAIGRSAVHVPTSAALDCSECHRVPPDPFTLAALFNHTQVAAQRCDACHNGQFTGGGAMGKNPAHIPTPAGADCNVCHVPRAGGAGWTLSPPFSHGVVTALACNACHNGSFNAAGAVGKSPAHIQSTNDCALCHRTTTWSDLIQPLNHTQVLGSCASCHAAEKTATHVPTPPSVDCGACHTNPPPTWAPATAFNHTQVTVMRCDACHNGSFPAATGKDANHVATAPGQDCSACHLNTTSFAGAIFDHTGITGSCASCHNGAIATGKSSVHFPTPVGIDCGACHRVPPDTFAMATTFSHTLVTALRCSQCHNGQFTGSGAVGKGPNHFATTAECNTCHNTSPGWAAPVTIFVHRSADYPGNHNPNVACLDCHTGRTATATWTSAGLKPACGGCHERNYRPGPHTKIVTPPTAYTAAELKDCTGACHQYDVPNGVIVRQRTGQHRVNAGGF